MASSSTLQFSILISLVLVSLFLSVKGKISKSCKTYECPTYSSSVVVSSGVVSFFVPKENQNDPAGANGLTVQRWNASSVAVRQFGGFVKNPKVEKEVDLLKASLVGTKWSATTPKSYIAAQYDPPFTLFDRVNEIWFLYE
ncbi:uncharacterized protein [Phaseolus vulgaris]|uniref:uncharacterized protein n=1 Tax=Phaseolus vulgaris TaxID=3885 RepID=UPI0035CC4799